MTIRVGVAGASGYAGGEILRVLLGHPEVQITTLAGHSSAGSQIEDHHPQLTPLFNRKIEAISASAFKDDDVVFLALPHGESAAIAKEIAADKLVLDCGADFRLQDADAWTEFYKSDHAGTWPYGLPELPGARKPLEGAKRIAVPGCYPTAVALAMYPALARQIVEPDVVVVAASGTSGAGRSLNQNMLGSEVMGSMSAYGVGGVHRHVPEIRQIFKDVAKQEVNVSFTPTLAPMSRGILVTCVATLRDGMDDFAVRSVYEAAAGKETFVHMLKEDMWPTTAAVLGSNNAYVQIAVDEKARRLVAVSAIDNLVKGTAGQAVQCMNIALGFDETTGLKATGVAP